MGQQQCGKEILQLIENTKLAVEALRVKSAGAKNISHHHFMICKEAVIWSIQKSILRNMLMYLIGIN